MAPLYSQRLYLKQQRSFELENKRYEESFTPIDFKLQGFERKLNQCGKFANINVFCKKGGEEHFLEKKRVKLQCEIRFCPKPGCLVHRFARQMETFKKIKRFDGLNNLWHFAISFEKISLYDFKNNFKKIRKRYNAVLNSFFEKLKKEGVIIQSLRVFDYSFEEAGTVLPHYHFGAIPIGAKKRRDVMLLIQKTRIGMISRMRVKTPFHFQSFGVKNKEGVLSYLAKRSAGLYTCDQSSKVKYVPSDKGKLLKDILNGKYYTLSDVLTSKEYLSSFYNRSHFVTIGGLPRPPHGSILTDAIPFKCPEHGELERHEVRVEVIFDEDLLKPTDPPPNFQNDIKIEVIYLGGTKCKI